MSEISLRPVVPDDQEFLKRLFNEVREPEFQALPPAQREFLLDMQFKAQQRSYKETFPRADWSLILHNGAPIGVLVIEGPLLVNIALIAEQRCKGFGTSLLNELMRERDVMTLHVESRNRARSLYERLGFTIVCEDGIYIEMRWQR